MGYMKWTGGGTIFVSDTTRASYIFAPIVYDKGAWVLHMLRNVVGESTFFDILRAYYSDPRFAHGAADTDGFKDVCETVSGMDLDYFFDEWIYGTYYPKYQYSYMSEPAAKDGYDLFIHLDQTQTTDPTHFTMPIDLKISTYSGDTTVRVFNDPRHEDFVVHLPTGAYGLSVDPDQWILRSVSSTSYQTNIVTTDLPSASLSTPYTQTLLVKGGTAPYSWELESGSLPDGLELDPVTGVISGTPTVADSFDFVAKVTDSSAPDEVDTQELYIVVSETPFVRGDVNGDEAIDLGDAIYLLNYLYKDGPEPIYPDAGDVNCDSMIDLGDVVYILNYLFKDGPAPC
jgi:hypothetical protein